MANIPRLVVVTTTRTLSIDFGQTGTDSFNMDNLLGGTLQRLRIVENGTTYNYFDPNNAVLGITWVSL